MTEFKINVIFINLFCGVLTLRHSRYCHTKDMAIGLNDGNIFVEAPSNALVKLDCGFCDDKDDHRTKRWFKKSRILNSEYKEIQLDFDKHRVYVTSSHSLIINKPIEEDGGFYKCQRSSENFHFLVDVTDGHSTVYEGNNSALNRYEDKFILPLNTKYKTDSLRIQFYLEWTDWGPCDACSRSPGESFRSRSGQCVLRVQNTSDYEEVQRKFSLSTFPMACRSNILSKIMPFIYKLSKNVPSFELQEHCDAGCNPAANDSIIYKLNKKNPFKYKKRRLLKAGSSLVLVCPEARINSMIEWTKNGRSVSLSNNTDKKLHIHLDTFGSLFLKNATDDESGTYVCSVDGKLIQETKIMVITNTPVISDELARNFFYLTVILLICLSCYCTALFIAWNDKESSLGGARAWLAR